jgi:hypothetical protein
MKRLALAAALILAPPTAPAFSESPKQLLNWIEAHMDACRSYSPDLRVGKEPGTIEQPALVYRTTVNSFPALVANLGGLPVSCGYSGSAGSPLAVFVKLPRHGWRLVFDSGIAVQGHEWKKKDGKDLLYLGLHGSYCGGLGVDECWSLMQFDGSAFVEIDRHKNYECPDGPQGRFGPAEVCNKWLQPDANPSGEFHSFGPPPGTVVAPKEMRDAWEKAQEKQRQEWHP